MGPGRSPADMADTPASWEVQAELDQVARYEFAARFPGAGFPRWLLDELPPTGGGKGPNPVRTLATAVGHCMSSTLFFSLERAHVPSQPIRTSVEAEVGRNPRGRLRVLGLKVRIGTAPLHEADRARFDHSVSVFEDFCTVSGAVREGIPIVTTVASRASSE